MKITYRFAWPTRWTFEIKSVKNLLEKYIGDGRRWVDPFAGENSPAEITNDINPETPAKYHLDGIEFIKGLKGLYKGFLLDPPYSLCQVMRSYRGFGKEVNKRYMVIVKNLVSDLVEIGGYVISFGWCSSGMGKGRGYEKIEVMLICHGELHNDTIVTVDKKVFTQIDFFKHP